LAGFDCQFTASASKDFFVEDLADFLEGEGSTLTEEEGWEEFATELQALVDLEWWDAKPSQTEYDAFQHWVETLQEEVVGFGAGGEVAFWTQMLESLEQQAEFNFRYVVGQWQPDVSGLRDEQMGENLIWLVEEGFPDRRVIVWAATLHVIRGAEQIQWESGDFSYEGFTTMGQVVWEELGTQSYTVGFTAATGEAGSWAGQSIELDPPREGSLEAAFVDAGFENAFLDYRYSSTGGEWLRDWMWSRPLGYGYMYARWPNHMDGIVFTRVMERSTPAASGVTGGLSGSDVGPVVFPF
jgi:erythromycin esterase-like protein